MFLTGKRQNSHICVNLCFMGSNCILISGLLTNPVSVILPRVANSISDLSFSIPELPLVVVPPFIAGPAMLILI